MPIPPLPSPAQIAGVILAGGQSRRMGGDPKGLRPLAGRPMIAHVIARIAPQLGPLAINANAPGYEGFGLPILPDSLPDFPGPLAGILTGLDWAAGLPGITHLMTVATDTPFLPRDLVARLAGAAEGSRPALAASDTGLHPVIGLWPVDLAG
ncbi:molybdenum cofactor guanylyltransferase, partial [Thioclava sp. BHET1]